MERTGLSSAGCQEGLRQGDCAGTVAVARTIKDEADP